ncbi:DNA-directed RNA polymerase II subunit RPB11-a [Acipenser oxyrinchus oxyrinchus]|uniref:DNA-directed RNA polymerase II subunit RPB11-a n=1 Tax=Acipenser oxyrinchus oxyrinchus TaxID=40147 RepID=A0AAD8FVG6_ACIOX|nr:DNA-directed RNA polymerase II subunit RPB11-a [Acipenser oxyrinchus oxyrinchus]KAK1158401.1 DNA-directed RNA polymerase II subunit RPB11-a [Acipenser oxyrinchus oxyrinchus]
MSSAACRQCSARSVVCRYKEVRRRCLNLIIKHERTPAFESFLLFEGEKKITITKDTKVPNACLFTLNKEDHTLGNIIRSQLLKDPQVLFAGYKTTPDYSPQEAFTNAITDLISELSLLEERFRVSIKDKQEGIE